MKNGSTESFSDYSSTTTHEFTIEGGALLPDVIEQFEMFLRGCGYSLINQRIDMVNNND
jgi:hypothetical protein